MKKIIKYIISSLLLLIFIGMSIYLIISCNSIGIIPNKYLYLGYGVLILLLVIITLLLTRKNIVLYVIGVILSIVLSIGIFIGCGYINKTNNAINNIAEDKVTDISYYALVKKDSAVSDISDLTDKEIGYISDNNTTKLLEALSSKVSSNATLYNDYNSILASFEKGNAIILNSGYVEALGDEVDLFSDSYKIIYTFTLTDEVLSGEYKDVTSEPFVIYISGIDTYGEISTRSRSDVNILMVINPSTHNILLVNTPRDFYVQLHGTTGLKDKLTHAGIYGIDMSVSTMEDLYGIDIDYYLRVNFNSLINVVDVIGGIDIDSDSSFTCWTNRSVKVTTGINHFNGAQALAYSRERHAYLTGDRHRGENQEQVITEIINKVTTTDTLINSYEAILDTLSSSFDTNMSSGQIKALAKMQIDNNSSYKITSISVTGADSNNYTYSMGTNYRLYVMEPNIGSMQTAKYMINEVLGTATDTDTTNE